MTRFLEICYRLIWPILLLAIILTGYFTKILQYGDINLIFYRLTNVSIALIVAHMFRLTLFPYVDLSELLSDNHKNELPDAIKFGGAFLGTMVFYYLVVYALTSGL